MPKKRPANQSYTSVIDNASRLLWAGRITAEEYQMLIESAVLFGMRMAFEQGARQLGMEPEDLTEEDLQRLQLEALTVLAAVPNLTNYVQMHNREAGYLFRELAPKLMLWYLLFPRVVNLALSVVGKDPKLEWVIGPTEKHCRTCSGYDGKVKRQSQWKAIGVYPRGPMLECKGYRCLCDFLPTTKPMSKGPLPRLV